MPQITVNGQKVTVDDSFFKLSRDDQDATVDEIAKSLPKRNGTIAETVDAAVRGAANALTFGFADRIAAGLGSATGIGGKKDDYAGNLEQQRAIDKANLEQHPYATIGGNLAGAVALPVGAASQAATLGGRMAAGAGMGALQGAAYGAGASPDLTNIQEVAGNVAQGAGVGALVGGVAPPVVEGLGQALGFGLRKTGIPGAIAGGMNPRGTAANLAADAMSRDAASGSAGLARSEFDNLAQKGVPVVNADLGGQATRELARTAANMSPEAESALNNAIDPRFVSQGPRIADMLDGIGGGNSVATLDALQTAARKANKPLYAKAYSEGASGIWNPDLQELTAAPAVQDAIRAATKTARNSDAAFGFQPTKIPFVEGSDGTLGLARNADGSQAIPSLQFWDHVKRNMDDMVDVAKRQGNNHAASVVTTLKNNLVEQLDKAAPTYAAARGMAAKAFGAQDALEAGAKFFSAKGQNQEYAKTIAAMSRPEKALFAHGFVSEMQRRVGEVGDRQTVLNKIAQSPAARQRVEMAVGPDNAKQLMTHLHAETVMDLLRQRVQGNSTTARQLENIKRIGEQLALPSIAGGAAFSQTGDLKDASLAGATAAGLKYGAGKINANVMRHVGELLASNDPAMIDKAIKTIQASKPIQKVLAPWASRLSSAIIANDAERRKAGYQ